MGVCACVPIPLCSIFQPIFHLSPISLSPVPFPVTSSALSKIDGSGKSGAKGQKGAGLRAAAMDALRRTAGGEGENKEIAEVRKNTCTRTRTPLASHTPTSLTLTLTLSPPRSRTQDQLIALLSNVDSKIDLSLDVRLGPTMQVILADGFLRAPEEIR